jgi:hypothetical protein
VNPLFWDRFRLAPGVPVSEIGQAGLVAYPGQGVYEFARWGHVAEWLRNGLQNRVHQFNSGRGLHL